MTNSDDPIVGKSVEEIEHDSGNLSSSPVQGEERRDTTGPVLIPGAAMGNVGGVTGVGAGIPGVVGAQLTRNEAGTDDGRGDKQTDSDEE